MPTNLQPILDKLISIDREIAAIREEMSAHKDHILGLIDLQTGMLLRFDQEHAATQSIVGRHTKELTELRAEIRRVRNLPASRAN